MSSKAAGISTVYCASPLFINGFVQGPHVRISSEGHLSLGWVNTEDGKKKAETVTVHGVPVFVTTSPIQNMDPEALNRVFTLSSIDESEGQTKRMIDHQANEAKLSLFRKKRLNSSDYVKVGKESS